jgi:predicted dithiol-disulfide oxidoreductase (DUF899 family)
MNLPKIVSREEWQSALQALRVKEKAHTRAGEKLSAERRRIPMVEITKTYAFQGPHGPVSLLDLFDGRRQLVLYHFMFAPDDEEGCSGCSMVVDNMCHPAHLHAKDISRVLVSRAPLAKLEAFKKRMGWSEPWFSSFGSDFNHDFGVTDDKGEHHALSVFLRDDQRIFQTYFTTDRGVEHLGATFTYFDITPFGRQEIGEDSPEGWPQGPLYEWWKHHDRYEGSSHQGCCH